MRCIGKPLGIAACVSLLMLQFSGFHVHADRSGHVGAPATAYGHARAHHETHRAIGGHPHHGHRDHGSSDLSGDDFSADSGEARDVSLLDSALVSVKLAPALLIPVCWSLLLPRARALASPDVVYPILSGRYTRWRPPLRAPPQTA